MQPQSEPQRLTLGELVLRTGILALKVLIPMLWLQSKLSPAQFLVGGAVLVLVVFFFDLPPWVSFATSSSSQEHRQDKWRDRVKRKE